MKRETKEQARRRDVPRVVLVGEANPYGGDPAYALYPAPDGCSGHRLCCLILGMRRANYLREFERVNLCPHQWVKKEAVEKAKSLDVAGNRLVLLGSKVCSAFNIKYEPFTRHWALGSGKSELIVLPHPSGLCRIWNQSDSIIRARAEMRSFVPHLKPMLGVSDGKSDEGDAYPSLSQMCGGEE